MNIFISQPMTDWSKEDVIKERDHMIELFLSRSESQNKEGSYNFISNYEYQIPEDELQNTQYESLLYLGKAIQQLGCCELVLFHEDWNISKGCRIEMEVVKQYNIPYMIMN